MPGTNKTPVSKSGRNGCRGIPGPGRPKGVPNKVTQALKDMIRGALEDAGGREYLAKQAKANPTAFMTLLGRLVPQELKADIEARTTVQFDPAQFFADLFKRPEG